jgi:hypothetical protein
MTEKEKIAKLKGANEVWEYILEGCELGDLYLQDLHIDAERNYAINKNKIDSYLQKLNKPLT